MPLISSDFLEWFSIMTALFGVLAIVKWWRSDFVPLHWIFFVAMTMGVIGISLFYHEIQRGDFGLSELIVFSRWLWFFVVSSTLLIFVSVLMYRK